MLTHNCKEFYYKHLNITTFNTIRNLGHIHKEYKKHNQDTSYMPVMPFHCSLKLI